MPGREKRVGVRCQGEVVDARPHDISIAIVVEGMAGEMESRAWKKAP